MVITQVVVLFIIIILKVTLLQIVIQLLKLQGLTSEPVNCTRDELLLDIFSQLVVELETLFDIRRGIIVILIRGGLGWREEVEERLGWYSLSDNPGLLGV